MLSLPSSFRIYTSYSNYIPVPRAVCKVQAHGVRHMRRSLRAGLRRYYCVVLLPSSTLSSVHNIPANEQKARISLWRYCTLCDCGPQRHNLACMTFWPRNMKSQNALRNTLNRRSAVILDTVVVVVKAHRGHVTCLIYGIAPTTAQTQIQVICASTTSTHPSFSSPDPIVETHV